MKTYTLAEDAWHNGILRLAGDTLVLSEAAAKYLGHALVGAAPAADAVGAEPVIEVEAVVAEKEVVAEKPHRRMKGDFGVRGIEARDGVSD